jgi:hypothetical protein
MPLARSAMEVSALAQRAVATDDDRRTARCEWSGHGSDPLGRDGRPLVVVGVVRPDPLHHLNPLLEEGVASLHVHPEGEELGAEVAGAHADEEPSPGEAVERGQPFGRQEGIPVGHHQQVRHELNSLGQRGDEAQRRHRVKRLVAAVGEPLLRGGRVLGKGDRGVPELLGDGDDFCQAFGRREGAPVTRAVDDVLEGEPHPNLRWSMASSPNQLADKTI